MPGIARPDIHPAKVAGVKEKPLSEVRRGVRRGGRALNGSESSPEVLSRGREAVRRPLKLNLHVGVHKTATTYIQRILKNGRPTLTESGIGYMPLAQFRKVISSRLKKIDPDQFRVESKIGGFFHNQRPSSMERAIISDENLVGSCTALMSHGTPFAKAKQRLTAFRRLFPDAEITLFCSIRSYDAFLASAYCEALRHGTFVTFSEFIDRVDLNRMRWPNAIEKFNRLLEPTRTVLWRYEDFQQHESTIIRELAFGVPLADASGDSKNVSFSRVALEILDQIATQQGPEVASRLVKPIGASLPKADGFGAFDPWSDEEKEDLRSRYEADCAAIDPTFWLVPPVAGAAQRQVRAPAPRTPPLKQRELNGVDSARGRQGHGVRSAAR
ncbi:MAG TPA: hypothetical protein VFE13_16940 [Caulobacteraceae bacterium]|nr:hypothetical protein [Caulobacteraceae bacterium]